MRFATSEMPTDSKSTFWFFFVLKKEQHRHTTPATKHQTLHTKNPMSLRVIWYLDRDNK
ncbi:hypothetical protein AB9K24_04970 [Meridianimaribacter flavus]